MNSYITVLSLCLMRHTHGDSIHDRILECPLSGETTYSACDPATNTITITRCEHHVDYVNSYTSSLVISDDSELCFGRITEVKVYIAVENNWIGDVKFWLGKDGDPTKKRQIFGPRSGDYGDCGAADLEGVFYDDAAGAALTGADCSAIYGSEEHQPLDSFDVYEGESPVGVWSVEMDDIFYIESEDDNAKFGIWALTLTVDPCPGLNGESCEDDSGVCVNGECVSGSDCLVAGLLADNPHDCECVATDDCVQHGEYCRRSEWARLIPLNGALCPVGSETKCCCKPCQGGCE